MHKIKKQESNNQVLISIHDNGTGIDPEILPRLFTKFMTTSKKEGGNGLGLYISKNIIEQHGGKIWGRNNLSRKTKGAEFGFLLPLAWLAKQNIIVYVIWNSFCRYNINTTN